MNAREDDRDRADWGADPELMAILRGADPAHSLPPTPPADLARLAEAAVAADHADLADLSGPAGAPRRRLAVAPWAAAAAIVLLAVVAGLGLTRDGRSTPVAEAPQPLGVGSEPAVPDPAEPTVAGTSSTAPASGPTVLQLPPVVQGRCAVPTAELLAREQVAFEGVVRSVEGGTALLDTTTVFAGVVADQVEVRAPSEQMGALLGAVQFEVGRSYLVSADDGQVTPCGYSGEASGDVRSLYQQAFGG